MPGATLRVMSFNMLAGGEQRGQTLSRTAEVLRAGNAGIAGLQETRTWVDGAPGPADNGATVAGLLGWNWFDQGGGTGIATRYEILGATPRQRGIQLRLPDGGTAWAFNVHLPHAPYQPYQLLRIPYADAPFLTTAAEAVASAAAARSAAIAECLAEAATVKASGVPVFLTGDFNEPSHLDWTPAAAAARRCPLPVEWPTSRAALGAGFTDGWRAAYPDAVASPGCTWTPLTAEDDPADHHDRIDFVLAAGPVKVAGAWIVGERRGAADLIVDPFPSDHRAVVVEFVQSRTG